MMASAERLPLLSWVRSVSPVLCLQCSFWCKIYLFLFALFLDRILWIFAEQHTMLGSTHLSWLFQNFLQFHSGREQPSNSSEMGKEGWYCYKSDFSLEKVLHLVLERVKYEYSSILKKKMNILMNTQVFLLLAMNMRFVSPNMVYTVPTQANRRPYFRWGHWVYAWVYVVKCKKDDMNGLVWLLELLSRVIFL